MVRPARSPVCSAPTAKRNVWTAVRRRVASPGSGRFPPGRPAPSRRLVTVRQSNLCRETLVRSASKITSGTARSLVSTRAKLLVCAGLAPRAAVWTAPVGSARRLPRQAVQGWPPTSGTNATTPGDRAPMATRVSEEEASSVDKATGTMEAPGATAREPVSRRRWDLARCPAAAAGARSASALLAHARAVPALGISSCLLRGGVRGARVPRRGSSHVRGASGGRFLNAHRAVAR